MISFFGNFGRQNFGNECTLQAILQNMTRFLPGEGANCICTSPQDVSARHGIPAVVMSYRCALSSPSTEVRARAPSAFLRWLRRLLIRLPLETVEWVKAFRALKDTRMLVMTGTGMLGDFGIGPFDLHYEILKWSIVAKIRGSKLLFVSVGAGPIAHPLSRRIVKLAISFADYRSYRDDFSKEYLSSIGFDTRNDFVYPDLAFSLKPEIRAAAGSRASRVVGVGLMDYYGGGSVHEYREAVYQEYLDKVVRFVAWLLDRGYTVRLLIGDDSYDRRIKGDVIERLKKDARSANGEIIDEPVSSVEHLLAQIAETDLVVGTRFHNVLLALMLNKPVIALSYHEKIVSLMAGMGMADYCQRIDRLAVDELIERFLELEGNAGSVKAAIERRVEQYRAALDEQYARIFDGHA